MPVKNTLLSGHVIGIYLYDWLDDHFDTYGMGRGSDRFWGPTGNGGRGESGLSIPMTPPIEPALSMKQINALFPAGGIFGAQIGSKNTLWSRQQAKILHQHLNRESGSLNHRCQEDKADGQSRHVD